MTLGVSACVCVGIQPASHIIPTYNSSLSPLVERLFLFCDYSIHTAPDTPYLARTLLPGLHESYLVISIIDLRGGSGPCELGARPLVASFS